VLGVSRWKNLTQVNQAAYNASIATNVQYLEIEGRKNGMQETRSLLIKSLNLYNQKYCGCPFSMQKED
jgi:predicted adenine nucleotide alpha hydrolase (AANH) superfamily ATPase